MPRPFAFGFTRYASALAPRATFATQAGAAAATTGAGAVLNGYLSMTNCNELVIDGWIPLETSLKLPSSTKLRMLPGSGLYCMKGLNAPAVTNLHWVSSYNGGSPIYNGSTIVDTNIAIVGEGGTIVGNRGNGTTGNSTSGDPHYSAGNASAGIPAGQWIQPVMLFGVNGLTLSGITVVDPPSFGFLLANCFNVRASNLASIDPVIAAGGTPGFGRNTDGFHLVGPIDDLTLSGFTCSANDDSLAFNATDGNYSGANNPAAATGPICYGSWAACYAGPITRCHAANIHLNNSLSGIRFLPGAYPIDGVTIDGVRGSVYGSSIVAVPFAGTGSGGTLGTVDVRGWRVNQTGSILGVFTLGVSTRSLRLDVQTQQSGGYTPSLNINGGGIDSVELRANIHVLATATEAPLLAISGATVVNAVVSGSRNRPGLAASTVPFVRVGGATVTNLALSGIRDDNGGGLFAQTSNAVTNLSVSGCLLTNTTATGLAVTGTVPVLTGGGNVGVTKAGTFTASSNFTSN